MKTDGTSHVLWLVLAADGHTGAPAAPAVDSPLALRPLAAGAVAVEADGAPVCVILTPAVWRQSQAAQAAWRDLFRWAADHLDTPTLRQMTAAAERLLASRSAPCRQP